MGHDGSQLDANSRERETFSQLLTEILFQGSAFLMEPD